MAVHRYMLHNEEILDTSARTLSPGQAGVLNGWGVFSTLRIRHGVLFAWERHYARMRYDAALMHIPFPGDPTAMRCELLRLVEANAAREGTLRVAVLRNHGGQFEGAGIDRDYDTIAFTKDPTRWGAGCRLNVTAEARHSGGPFASAKILSWSMNLTMLEEAVRQGYDETILLDSRGLVSECTSANIFAVIGSEVITPPRISGCLPGVTRAILLEEISIPGVRVFERDLTVDDLKSADEVFLTSSTRDLLPVLEIADHLVRQSKTVMPALQAELGRFIERYVEEAKLAPAKY